MPASVPSAVAMIAAMNGLGQHQVRAVAPEVGGGFGAKINIYGEEYVASAISKQLGLPIKWIEDRAEAFVATTLGANGYLVSFFLSYSFLLVALKRFAPFENCRTRIQWGNRCSKNA